MSVQRDVQDAQMRRRLGLQWSDAGASFDVCDSAGRPLLVGCAPDAVPIARSSGGTYTFGPLPQRGEWLTTGRGYALRLKLQADETAAGALTLAVEVVNTGDQPVALESVT